LKWSLIFLELRLDDENQGLFIVHDQDIFHEDDLPACVSVRRAYVRNNVGRKISADPYPVFGAGEDTGVQQITI